MRLHRLTLTDYRGVDHRDIEFADRGVTVVTGANEVGKSSLIEALDLLLEYKDRSASKDVKAVKPTHADVGAQVEAEISTGPYRFVYRKRFHKKPETVLTVLEPAREQLTGDEAHERVQTMLAQTMDTGLWRAQRVLQATSTTPVDLSDCDALSRALDLAAGRGDDGQSSTVNPALIEQIDAEYRRYFTGTGRPTGEWAAAISALADAEQQEARCRAAVDEVEQRLDTHTERSAQLAELEAARPAAERRAAAAQAAAEQVAEIVDGLDTAEREAKDARLTAATAAAAAAERAALRDELTR
ncbi:AAA family ATPase, partial [Mycolicibacterium brumae]